MQLAKYNIAPVAAEDLGLRHRWCPSHFVGIPQHKLSGLERLLVRIAACDAATFDCRMADSIAKAKGFSLPRPHVAILAPERRDAGRLAISFPGPLHRRFKMFCVWRDGRHHNVNLG